MRRLVVLSLLVCGAACGETRARVDGGQFFTPDSGTAAADTGQTGLPDSDAGQTGRPDSDVGPPPAIVQVQRVVDGDTVNLSANAEARAPDGTSLNGQTVRLLGIDTPEIAKPPDRPMSECWGDEARDAARDLMQGLRVTLVFGSSDLRDQFGRLLAYVELPDGRIANEVMLQEGDARTIGFPHPQKQRYEALEDAARDAGVGLWAVCR